MRRRLVPALAIALAACSLPALPVHAATTDDEQPALGLTLATERVIGPGADLVVTGTVTNLGGEATPAGTVTIGVTPDELERAELEAGLADPASVPATTLATVELPPLANGGSAPITATIPAAQVDATLAGADWGALLLTGDAEAPGATSAHSASGFVWSDGEAPASLNVVTIVPFTTPGDTEGLLDAETLEAYLSGEGVLRAKLDAVIGTQAAIALDPRILASIRALGADAPESAVDWLADLRGAENVVFPLSYADSDLSLTRAAGAPAVLGPGSFESSLDPDAFAGGTIDEADTATPTPSPSPTPSPTASPGTLPTGDDLLRWDYTFEDLAWPTAARPGDLPFFAASGLTRSLVPSSSLADPPFPLPATATIEGTSALILDSVLSNAVSAASRATSETGERSALGNAAALLAATAEDAESGTTVIVGLSRSWPSSTVPTGRAITAVSTLPWVTAAALDSVTGNGTELALRADQPDDRVPAAAQLIQDDAAIARFATVLERPELLTGRERLRLLAVLSAQWLQFPEAWQTAAADLHTRYDGILHSVSITQTSIVAMSPGFPVPVFVRNDLDFPVTITLTGRPSNGRLLVEEATATIDAQSSQRVAMPARSIANGRVTLTVTATSAAGVPISGPATIELDVQAEWEVVGISVVVGLVVVLFGFGLWRNIRRRRRRAKAAE